MALQLDDLVLSMTAAIPMALNAAKITGTSLADRVKTVLPGEIKKMAAQLIAIEEAGFSQPLADQLLGMQRESFEDVLTALFEITLKHAQDLINELLNAVKGTVNNSLGFALI